MLDPGREGDNASLFPAEEDQPTRTECRGYEAVDEDNEKGEEIMRPAKQQPGKRRKRREEAVLREDHNPRSQRTDEETGRIGTSRRYNSCAKR